MTFTFDPNLEFNYSKLFRCFTLSRFHIFNFSGLRFCKKKEVFLSFVDLHLFSILRTSVKANRNFWGLSDSDRKNISVFSSFAWKVREVAIAWRFHTCKYHSFWLVAIAKFQPYASIVLKLVVFPGRRANYGFIISRKQNSVHESSSMSRETKMSLTEGNYIHEQKVSLLWC